MIRDVSYLGIRYKPSLLEHRYGDNIRILCDPFSSTLISRLSSKGVVQPEVGLLVEKLYTHFTTLVASSEFPVKVERVSTRMSSFHSEGVFEGMMIDTDTRVVVVSVARAGTYPAQICYNLLNLFMNPAKVRQDFIFMNREVDENGEVIGVRVSGRKIGGDIDGAIILIPDPMGATGYSMNEVLRIYKEEVKGRAMKFIAMNLVITPEFIRVMKREHPDALLYAMRLDRGLSDAEILETIPGTFHDREKGLNEHQYIVPGAGGLGEVFNNAYE